MGMVVAVVTMTVTMLAVAAGQAGTRQASLPRAAERERAPWHAPSPIARRQQQQRSNSRSSRRQHETDGSRVRDGTRGPQDQMGWDGISDGPGSDCASPQPISPAPPRRRGPSQRTACPAVVGRRAALSRA